MQEVGDEGGSFDQNIDICKFRFSGNLDKNCFENLIVSLDLTVLMRRSGGPDFQLYVV